MRYSLCGLLLVVMFFFGFSATAADAPFVSGETIHYSIKQMGVKVGKASLVFEGEKNLDGRKTLLIVFTAQGIKFYDQERIYVDPQTFRPVRVVRDLDIFGRKEKIVEAYGHDGRVHVRKNAGGKLNAWTLPRQGAIDNIYGFIYRYRQQASGFRGEKFNLSLPTLDVVMQPANEMNFRVGRDIYRAVLIKSVPSRYSIWMDTSPRRFPLRIAGAIGLANTVMTMVNHEEEN